MFTAFRSVLVSMVFFVAFENCSAEERKESDLSDQVRAAVKKSVEYLEQAQRDGDWEERGKPISEVFRGGVTSVALLALLDSGVRPDEAVIKKGLEYLRKIEPDSTYVVALQVVVLTRVKMNVGDKRLIQHNADWLAKHARRDGKRLIGWGYREQWTEVDNSNTEFAIMALHAAQEAGAGIESGLWRDVREYYLRTQSSDGGWAYFAHKPFTEKTTLSMTSAGVCGLVIADKHLKEKNDKSRTAKEQGLSYLGKRFKVDNNSARYYALWCLARAGRLSGKRAFSEGDGKPSHDWYREGADYLLKQQERDGSWKGNSAFERNPLVNTCFALLFFSKRDRDRN